MQSLLLNVKNEGKFISNISQRRKKLRITDLDSVSYQVLNVEEHVKNAVILNNLCAVFGCYAFRSPVFEPRI